MSHQHTEHPSHRHQGHGPMNYNRAFAIGIILNIGFVAVELVFGFLSNSLALVTDAGHNLSDVISLVLAWGAAALANRAPTVRRTYGFRRVTIYASFISAVMLLVALGIIVWEAFERFSNPIPVDGISVMAVAGVGFIINGITALLFMKGQKHDLNIKGAFLHMAADAGVSMGVVVQGGLLLLTGWLWLDAAVSIGIALVIVLGTWGLLRDSMGLAIDAVPAHIDPREVGSFLLKHSQVEDFHDLHIWAMSTTETALTVHLEVCKSKVDNDFLELLSRELHDRFHIGHATIQVEHSDKMKCSQAEPGSL